MKRTFAFAALLCALLLCGICAPASRADEIVYVEAGDAVTAQIADFIGGAYLTARPYRSSRAKAEHVLLLHVGQLPEKALRGFAPECVHVLTDAAAAADAYSDPAALPEIAQRIAAALCDILPARRGYFGRRLGEFDAQLEALLITGRKKLSGRKAVCASRYIEPFLRAFGAEVETIAHEELESLAETFARSDTKRPPANPYSGRAVFVDAKRAEKLGALKGRVRLTAVETERGDLLRNVYEAVLMCD